jgi:hypothetical protein
LYKVSSASDPSRARAALTEALAIVEAAARESPLTAREQDFVQRVRAALAKLPPEAAKAR